ncbi:MAG: VOC family protein [Actinomycetota bacterium]|nr:VOC family protein [Actinomycetota bacterium]
MIDLSAPVCEPGNCHRIAFAVRDLPAAVRWFEDVLGAVMLPIPQQAGGAVEAEADGGQIAVMWLQSVPIVLLGSTQPDGIIGRYLAANGPSVQSLAWEIPDMWGTENLLRANGMKIVGTDIEGRHFFVHPKHTEGMLLEYTDDVLPGDPRRGNGVAALVGSVAIASVQRVTTVVPDIDAAVAALRYTFNGVAAATADEAVDVVIGDLTVRLVTAATDGGRFAGLAGSTRFHSVTLAVPDLAALPAQLTAAGIGVAASDTNGIDGQSLWADPAGTLGLRFEFVAA